MLIDTSSQYKKSIWQYFLIIVFLFITHSYTLAQTTTIKSLVLDKMTKEPLTGANVVVQGTSLGAAADLDGRFIIRNVPIGKQTLVISYIGYNSLTIELNVSASGIEEENFYLEPKTLEGETVVVTAQARGQLEAINQQLSSTNIINVVSSEKMKELPDANIAESIGRLPGISLQRNAGEAYAVVVRGLSPKFNEVTIEGVPMSSTNYYDRSIDLSLLSNDLVRGVEVSKTLRPDMDANALGGTINLTLKSAQKGLHYNVQGNGGYNKLRDTYGNYKFSGSASNRFFDDQLGVQLQGNIELKQLPSDQFNANYDAPTFDSKTNQFSITTQNAQLTETSTKRQRYGLSLILDYTSDLVDVKFFNVYDQKSDSNITRGKTSRFSTNEFWDQIFVNETKTEQRTHSLQALFKLGDTELPISLAYTKGEQNIPNGLEFDFLQTNLKAIPASKRIYGEPSTLMQIQGVINPYSVNTTLYNMSTNNTNLTDESYDAKIDWKVPFKLSDSFSGILSAGAKYHSVKRSSSNTQDYLFLLYGEGQGNRIDLINSYPFLKGINSALQAGIPAFPFVDSGYTRTSILGYPIGPGWNIYQLVDMQNSYYPNHKRAYRTNGPINFNQDYTDKENSTAGYVMGEFNIGSDLTIVPGVRYQEEKTDISAYHIRINTTSQNGLDGVPPRLVETKRNFPQWYPSVNIKYKATENVQILGAVYKSVSLPSYGEINPLVELQDGGVATGNFAGNPKLIPSTAWNFDLGASLFSNDIGLFTVNLFYKEIKDLIYDMQNYYFYFPYAIKGVPDGLLDRLPEKSYFDTTWANNQARRLQKGSIPMNDPSKAYLRGIEFSWQTHLWYLPWVLSGIVLDLNLSLMSSNQEYPSFAIQPRAKPTNPDTLVYTTTAGALQNQPKAIYNAIIGWDYEGFSSRFSFRYQQKTLTSIDTRFGLQNSYYDNVLLVDISLKQQLFIKGLSVFANATNINSHIDDYYYSHPTYVSSTTTYPAGQLPTSGQTYGWALQLGVSYYY